MPFNGAGLFTRVYQWINDQQLGIFVDATRTDTDSNDIAAGLSNCITRDGQSPPTASIPFGGDVNGIGGQKIIGLLAGAQNGDSVNYGQVFNSPAFITPTSTTSPSLGDNSLRLATTAYVVQTAFTAALPAIVGQSGKFISTDGTTSFWSRLKENYASRATNVAITADDSGRFIEITGGTFTQSIDSPALLGANFYCFLQNSGTGNVTIPASDGVTNWIMYPGESRKFKSDGTTLISKIERSFDTVFIASANFIKPPGYAEFEGLAWSGGNSGARTNAATNSFGGAGGGAFPFIIPAAMLAASTAITIGAGGLAVSGVANGNLGGATSIGTLLTIWPGVDWRAGGAVGVSAAASSTGTAVGIGFDAPGAAASPPNSIYGGAPPSSDATNNSASSVYGGAAGGSVAAAGTIRLPGVSQFGGNGGAAVAAANGVAGVAPGGGGGATQTGTQSGAGARGEVRIRGRV